MPDPEYFTLTELRARPDVGDAVKYPDEMVYAAAAYIVSVIEREVGTSFIPRTVTESTTGGSTGLFITRPYVRSLTAVTVAGDPVADAVLRPGGLVRRSSRAPFGTDEDVVAVTYVVGYSEEPPADVKEQALQGTRAHLLATSPQSSVSARQTSLSNEMGVIQFAVAGENRPTGYPEVDAMILGWKRRLDVFGFA